MPYKDPERKKKWEREHREQRNEQRMRRISTRRTSPQIDMRKAQKPRDPAPEKQSRELWKTILGIAIGAAVVMISFIGFAIPDGNMQR